MAGNDYKGTVYGKLTLIREKEPFYDGKRTIRVYECKCECGTIKDIKLNSLQSKIGPKSCGCIRINKFIENIKSRIVAIYNEGDIVGHLTVIKESEPLYAGIRKGRNVPRYKRTYECQCECGTTKIYKAELLRSGKAHHCGCLTSYYISKSNRTPINVGEKYGRLTILQEKPQIKTDRRVECQCECGTTKEYSYQSVKYGHTKSCGCIREETPNGTTHGLSSKRDYNTRVLWVTYTNMMKRCCDANHPLFKHYGGRGISVCERWRMDIYNFINDMGFRPSDEHSIDRIDVDKDYSPDNCRWALMETQVMNKRSNKWYKEGKQNPTI